MAANERGTSDEREALLSAHLAKAGDLLRADQTAAAEREIAEALVLGPDDVRARNLLGLLRFRAGKYDEAHDVYRELVQRDPGDAALRMNLGLVELRLGKNADAAASLQIVVGREPQNVKAQGYLGLALMRAGELSAAHRAFMAAGQLDLARQVEDQMAVEHAAPAKPRTATGAMKPIGPRTPPAASTGAAAIGGAARTAASDEKNAAPEAESRTAALRGLEADLSLEHALGPRPAAAPQTTASATTVRHALALSSFVDAHELRTAEGEPFAIVDALLVARVSGHLPTRTIGAIASSGRLSYAPIARRVRGKPGDEPFGEGEDALVKASGTGILVISPRGQRFTIVALASDEGLYLRESAVFAFEDSLYWENGRIPGGGPSGMTLVQLRGQGRVVMRTRRQPSTLRIGGGDVVYVDQDALIGWLGGVVPQQLRGVDGEPTQFVSCSGDGALIIDSRDDSQDAASPVAGAGRQA